MAELQFRLERDRSTGRVHKRYADEYGRFELTRERCQRDQSGSYEVLPDGTDRSAFAEEDLCGWDFPRAEAGA